MKKKSRTGNENEWVIPGDKIAIIEEFLPNESCYEEDGVIFGTVFGKVKMDRKKHKISVIPNKDYNFVKNGDIGVGRVEFIKKQIASVDIYQLNEKHISPAINSILHISEVSRRFVKNMYEVARPGDWIKFQVIRSNKPVYISLIGDSFGVVISYCIQCGSELDFKQRNTLRCPNCELIQPRITSKHYGKPSSYILESSRNETR